MKDIDQKIETLLKWINTAPDSSPNAHVVSSKLIVRDNQTSGRGLYAKEGIRSGEKLINIPHQFLLNHTSVSKHILQHSKPNATACEDPIDVFYRGLGAETLRRLSSFQLISMYLVLETMRETPSFWAPFIDMLPELDELSAAPIVKKVLNKDSSLWAVLPRSTRKHSEEVLERFEKDYDVILQIWKSHDIYPALLQSIDLERRFLWAWMCINSRCLYMDISGKDGPDNFTMAPYVDFLNHTSHEECGIKIDATGFQVHTTTEYMASDELFFSYGPHSNEFLFCEYGFVLPQNKWNYLDVSDLIKPLFRPAHVQYLKSLAYYGDYTVNIEGMSFRTEIALATLQETKPETSKRLSDLVSGLSDGDCYTQASHQLLRRLLQKILGDCKSKLDRPDVTSFTSVCQLYEDMKEICEAVLNQI